MKILIIEDNRELQTEMAALVTEIGYSPILVSSGEEALQLIGVVEFDMVILDVEMPGLDGFETTSLMREALGTRWVPIIFATSEKGDESVLAGIEAGGDDYLIKPFTPGLLKAKLKAMQRIAKMQGQLEELINDLAQLSEHDGLTHLLNRRAFTEKATQILLSAKRHRRPSALIMLDVDHFKLYNDSYGHAAGDECLKQVAQCLKEVIKRGSDLIARYGGEEFIILLPETDLNAATMIAQKMLDTLNNKQIPHQASLVADHLTISIGIDVSADQETLDELILGADKNLYQAKENGRNQFVVKQGKNHKTILIADDNNSNLTLLTNILKPLGNIITVDNKTDCLELAKDIKPDLILLDTDRQTINGKETSKMLKIQDSRKAAPILFITTNYSKVDQHINIAKPIDVELVREQVADCLSQ